MLHSREGWLGSRTPVSTPSTTLPMEPESQPCWAAPTNTQRWVLPSTDWWQGAASSSRPWVPLLRNLWSFGITKSGSGLRGQTLAVRPRSFCLPLTSILCGPAFCPAMCPTCCHLCLHGVQACEPRALLHCSLPSVLHTRLPLAWHSLSTEGIRNSLNTIHTHGHMFIPCVLCPSCPVRFQECIGECWNLPHGSSLGKLRGGAGIS